MSRMCTWQYRRDKSWHFGNNFFNISKFSPRYGTHYFTWPASTRIPTHLQVHVQPSLIRQIACHGVNPMSCQCEPCFTQFYVWFTGPFWPGTWPTTSTSSPTAVAVWSNGLPTDQVCHRTRNSFGDSFAVAASPRVWNVCQRTYTAGRRRRTIHALIKTFLHCVPKMRFA